MTRWWLILALVAGLSLPAHAKARLLDSPSASNNPSAHLLPVNQLPTPGNHGKFDFFLLGLGLTLGGLSLGAAGFAILAICDEGSSCYSPTTRTLGWILAAPGIIPLVVGLVMLYVSVGGKRGMAFGPSATDGGGWALGAAPLQGGGAVFSAATRF